MTKNIFYSKEFIINGISIPEFELTQGNLIRFYIPNFDKQGKPLGFDLTIDLIKHFQNQKSELRWAKNFNRNSFLELLKPLTVNNYLTKTMDVDPLNAKTITKDIGIELTDKVEQLSFTVKKALTIKALFDKNETIILDYNGVGALEIESLERLVNTEIEMGKSAIAFDRLEYKADNEPYKNIKPIKITVPNTM